MDEKLLGKYLLIEKLGSGATSDVYLARDTYLGREVALKVLKPSLVADSSAFARFAQEAQAAAGLFHPNIATVLDMGEADGRFFIAMRYINGQSLDAVIKEKGALSWEQVLRLAEQIGSALDYAHQRGFLHRDVKPNNIICSEDGDYVLTDFGLTRAMMSTGLTSHTGAILGTPSYIAPEIWLGEPATQAADQYALACVLVEALTGKVLFTGETPPAIMTSHVLKGPQILEQMTANVPEGLGECLKKALAVTPGDRYASLGELVKAVQELSLEGNQVKVSAEFDTILEPDPVIQAHLPTEPKISLVEPVVSIPLDARVGTEHLEARDEEAFSVPQAPVIESAGQSTDMNSYTKPQKENPIYPSQQGSRARFPKWIIGLAVFLALVGCVGIIGLIGLNVLRSNQLARPAGYEPTLAATAAPDVALPAASTVPIPTPTSSFDLFRLVWEYSPELRDGEFLYPVMAAVSNTNLIYVTDSSNCQVQVFTMDGAFVRRWGSCGDDPGELRNPDGIAVDQNGFVYVADKHWPLQGHVDVYDSDGAYIATWGELDAPSGIAVSSDGRVYVVEQDQSRIVIYATGGEFLGAFGSYGTGEGQFDFRNGFPSGIALDADGYVYVSDMANNRVQKFAPDGQFLIKWGVGGSGIGQMNWPMGIAVNSQGVVYVVDGENHRVQMFDGEGAYLGSLGDFGGGWINPLGIAVSPDDQVIVVNSSFNQVRVYNAQNEYLSEFGEQAYSRQGELLYASGVAVSTEGDIYIADSGHGAIAHFDPDGNYLASIPVPNVSYLSEIVIDDEGNFYLVDGNNDMIIKISPEGGMLASWGGDGGENAPGGTFWCLGSMAIANDRLFASDYCTGNVSVFTLDGVYLNRWAATNSSDTSRFVLLTTDIQGRLFTLDLSDNRIRYVSDQGEILDELSIPIELGETTTDFKINPSGHFFISPYNYSTYDGLIVELDGSGELIKTLEVESATRFAFSEDGYLYLTSTFALFKYDVFLQP